MRHVRIALLFILTLAGTVGAVVAPAGAETTTRTLLVATEDVTGNSWDGIYYQRYVINVASDGSFTGTGSYLGFKATRVGARSGASVACGLQQTITGVVGRSASYTAQYLPPEEAYWYSFRGKIEGTKISGTGTNVNGQIFNVRTATAKELASASCP